MSTVDMNIVVANIKACRQVLKGLQNCERPMAPRNEEWRWAEFKDKMGESVRFLYAFKNNTRVDTENLRRAKRSLDEADEKLKAWAGGSAVLYNVERGTLAPDLLYCKRIIAWLLEHVGEVSEASGEVGAIQTEVTKSVVHPEGRMAQMVHMRGLLRRIQEL